MAETTATEDAADDLNEAVAQGGSYELIRGRLMGHVDALESGINEINAERQTLFGQTAMEVVSRVRVRTENNCVPRDIVRVGDRILFGYNVFIGLKRETQVADVFAAYRMESSDEGFEITPEAECDFLTDESFLRDFRDLYAYYKSANLARMQVIGPDLYVTFRIGEAEDDVRVFHWHVERDGSVRYVDDRAERAIPTPARHPFEWLKVGRDDLVSRAGQAAYSLNDQLFVEIGGTQLRFKLEDNTETGAVLFTDQLEDGNQALDDADIRYREISGLVLVRVLPYGEELHRFYVFDPISEVLERHDEIGHTVRELPEDHGVLFPGGYYLTGVGSRRFEDEIDGLRFSRALTSPNGEDVLYVFYETEAGRYGLYAYNLIKKALENPLYAHGYSLFPDGTLVIFKSESAEPARNHPMQIWRTAFFDEDHVKETEGDSPLAKIGNNELVRGISDLVGLVQAARSEQVTMSSYNALIQSCRRVKDAYYWLEEDKFVRLRSGVSDIESTAELVLDEFEKIAEIRAHANNSLNEAMAQQEALVREISTSDWHHARDFVRALGEVRKQRGHLLTIKELRHIDVAAIEKMEAELIETNEALSQKTVGFLLQENALDPYRESLAELAEKLESAKSTAETKPVEEGLDELGQELDLLTEILGSLAVDDATRRTAILESISELFAHLNAAKAKVRNKVKSLGSGEAKAEFAAQFTLFSQSVTNALAQADTPEACDEHLARLVITLEELEGKFGLFDEFLPDIVAKREELRDAFDTHRQSLLDQRQRRAQSLHTAAGRILEGIAKRAERYEEVDELNAHFSTDTMVVKLKDTIAELRDLDDAVKADDLESRLRSAQDNAVRSLRDKRDIFESGGAVIKLGQHRFSVNQQPLELTLIPREDGMYAHLTGTGFAERIDDERLNSFEAQWSQSLVSETETVYRSEYLASEIIRDAQLGETLTWEGLQAALLDEKAGEDLVRGYASDRYTEGYEKGVHDHDALIILKSLVPRMDELGLLVYAPHVRALGLLFWFSVDDERRRMVWRARAHTASHLARLYPGRQPYERLVAEIQLSIEEFLPEMNAEAALCESVARYLVQELAEDAESFTVSQRAHDLIELLRNELRDNDVDKEFTDNLSKVERLGVKFQIAKQWLGAIAENRDVAEGIQQWTRFVDEAAAYLLLPDRFGTQIKAANPDLHVSGLLGQHARVIDGELNLSVDEFIARLEHHRVVTAANFREFLDLRMEISEELRAQLKLEDFIPRPLSSFVRNKLLNEAYLPIIGDNLAKQIGAADESKRTDLMGLLLLISPPGYGKTTLMEYVASRLGLIFVKVNGPALGHSVVSVDPQQAPNATARQELEKLNLSLEMGNNVMLYIDDIQHTHPEFLQKFISLCDGTRRIEGVWRGQPKTYDLRGRRFCVIMAGNPYTESGDVFQVPDMLANRADVYNLGDVLSGREEVFSLSYIENSLTSNPILAPLATRDMDDIYRFIDKAAGRDVADADFVHAYSSAESNEIVSVLNKMRTVQEVVLAVNREYIRSAATDEQFRTEPPFKLQGSYRNMNKLAEKLLPIMNEAEIQELLDDHYAGESQLLTGEAEFNVLRLKELRGQLSDEDTARLEQIRKDYQRTQAAGGRDADAGTKLANQLAHIREALDGLKDIGGGGGDVAERLSTLNETLKATEVTVVNQPSKVVEDAMQTLAHTIETTFLPVVASMDKKIDLDLAILRRMNALNERLGIDPQDLDNADLDPGDEDINPADK